MPQSIANRVPSKRVLNSLVFAVGSLACSAYAKSGPCDRGAIPIDLISSRLRLPYAQAVHVVEAAKERGVLVPNDKTPGTVILAPYWRVRMIDGVGVEADWRRNIPFCSPDEEIAKTREEARRVVDAGSFDLLPTHLAAA